MMQIYTLFRQELSQFWNENRWVFFVFVSMLSVVVLTHRGQPIEVCVVFSAHFVADLMIMMMFRSYALGERKIGTSLQLFSTLLFLALKIHSGLTRGSWQYLAGDALFLLAAYKNYQNDLNQRQIGWINTWSCGVLAILILCLIYIPNGLLLSVPQWVQTTGIFLFAIALVNSASPVRRNSFSLFGLGGMVLGSALECGRTFQGGNLDALALSYFLLPTTVLLFYLNQSLPSNKVKLVKSTQVC